MACVDKPDDLVLVAENQSLEQSEVKGLSKTKEPNLPTRCSTRITKRPRRDVTPPPSPPKRQNIEKETKTPENYKIKGRRPRERKRTRVDWSPEDKTAFFNALAEHGKDFVAIQNSLNQLQKRKNDQLCLKPKDIPPEKSKDQIRFFYYRTWAKISKYIINTHNAGKHILEIFGLLSYSEFRKRGIVTIDEYAGNKLNELAHRGTTLMKHKGKYYRIKTPMCKILKKYSRTEDTPKIKDQQSLVPDQVTLELKPKNMESWIHVHSIAQNPRLRIVVNPDRKLASIIELLHKKWKPHRVKLKEDLQVRESVTKELKLTMSSEVISHRFSVDEVQQRDNPNLEKLRVEATQKRRKTYRKKVLEKNGQKSTVCNSSDSKQDDACTANDMKQLCVEVNCTIDDNQGNKGTSNDSSKEAHIVNGIDVLCHEKEHQPGITVVNGESTPGKSCYKDSSKATDSVQAQVVDKHTDVTETHRTSSVTERKWPGIEAHIHKLQNAAAQSEKDKVQEKQLEEQLDKIDLRSSWTRSSAGQITVLQMILCMGGVKHLEMEYEWVDIHPTKNYLSPSAPLHDTKMIDNMMRRLVQLANSEFALRPVHRPKRTVQEKISHCKGCSCKHNAATSNKTESARSSSPLPTSNLTKKHQCKDVQEVPVPLPSRLPSISVEDHPASSKEIITTVVNNGATTDPPLDDGTVASGSQTVTSSSSTVVINNNCSSISSSSNSTNGSDSAPTFRIPTVPDKTSLRPMHPPNTIAPANRVPNVYVPRKSQRRNLRKPIVVQRSILPNTPLKALRSPVMTWAMIRAAQNGHVVLNPNPVVATTVTYGRPNLHSVAPVHPQVVTNGIRMPVPNANHPDALNKAGNGMRHMHTDTPRENTTVITCNENNLPSTTSSTAAIVDGNIVNKMLTSAPKQIHIIADNVENRLPATASSPSAANAENIESKMHATTSPVTMLSDNFANTAHGNQLRQATILLDSTRSSASAGATVLTCSDLNNVPVSTRSQAPEITVTMGASMPDINVFMNSMLPTQNTSNGALSDLELSKTVIPRTTSSLVSNTIATTAILANTSSSYSNGSVMPVEHLLTQTLCTTGAHMLTQNICKADTSVPTVIKSSTSTNIDGSSVLPSTSIPVDITSTNETLVVPPLSDNDVVAQALVDINSSVQDYNHVQPTTLVTNITPIQANNILGGTSVHLSDGVSDDTGVGVVPGDVSNDSVSISALLDLSLPAADPGCDITSTSFSGLLDDSSSKFEDKSGGKMNDPRLSDANLSALKVFDIMDMPNVSPAKLARAGSTTPSDTSWANADEFSLSQLLESPLKRQGDTGSSTAVADSSNMGGASNSSLLVPAVPAVFGESSRDSIMGRLDMDASLQTLLTENSVDYMAKFADLAAQITSNVDSNLDASTDKVKDPT